MKGSFDVSGTRKDGQTCCILGEVSSISFGRTNALQVGLQSGSWEIDILGFQNIRAYSSTEVTICSPDEPNVVEASQVNLNIEWWVQLTCRAAIIEVRAGPLLAQVGIDAGIFSSGIEVTKGQGVSTTFSIDERLLAIGGTVGPFASIRCGLGKLQARAMLDYILAGLGNSLSPSESVVLSIGMGIEF